MEELQDQPQAQEQASQQVGTEQPTTPKEEPELKIVVIFKGRRGSVGIQAPTCDPVLRTVEGSLTDVLAKVSELLAEAQAVWREQPKYPDYKRPPAPEPKTPISSGRPGTKATPGKAADRPKMF